MSAMFRTCRPAVTAQDRDLRLVGVLEAERAEMLAHRQARSDTAADPAAVLDVIEHFAGDPDYRVRAAAA